MSLLCLCIVGIAIVVAPLELIAYSMVKSIGCSWTDQQQSFTCAGGLVGHMISTVLNLPLRFSDARELTLGGRMSGARGFTIYLFDAIFILALIYPLLILFAPKASRRK